MGLKNTKFEGVYASVLADGTISVKCNETDPGAVKREYEDRDTKQMVTKWEKQYTELSGFITSIEFKDGKFGKQLQLTVKDGEDEIILGFTVASNFCEDFMKKLPNINFEKEVTLKPYSFDSKETGKNIKGVGINQGEDKIFSFFSKKEDGKWVACNGIPTPEKGKKYDDDDWKVFFIEVRKFLVNFIETNVAPMISNVEVTKEKMGAEISTDEVFSETVSEPEQEVTAESIKADLKKKKAF